MIQLETLIELKFLSQFELFELILLLKSDKQFPVEQFEATVSQSTVPSPPLKIRAHSKFQNIILPDTCWSPYFLMSGRALHRQPRVGSPKPLEKVLRPAWVHHLYKWNFRFRPNQTPHVRAASFGEFRKQVGDWTAFSEYMLLGFLFSSTF